MSSITVSNFRPVTAADVRKAMRSDESLRAGLSDDALHTIADKARGRLHPNVIEAFNKGRKPSERYNERAQRTVAITYKHTTASGSRNKTVYVPETEARKVAGEVAGQRGPLSKAAKAKVAEALANA